MYTAIIYTLISYLGFQFSYFWNLAAPERTVKAALSHKQNCLKQDKLKTVSIKINMLDNHIRYRAVPFNHLPGWDKTQVKTSLIAFQKSCKTLLHKDPKLAVGSSRIQLKAGDWQPACRAALLVNTNSEAQAHRFFEQWFSPIELRQKQTEVKGLFTGYYIPEFKGSLMKTKAFRTPIYGLPRRSRHYTRQQIDNGALKNKAPVIAWIKDPIDRLFLEIEGSGAIHLKNGKKVYLDYAGENGAPYTSIGSLLIKRGVLSKDNASRKAITRYLRNHPQKINTLLHKNKSFVFFQRVKRPVALGAQGAVLTPGYSLAVDKKWIPLGTPLWVNSKKPNESKPLQSQFQRLMIAQDTGGAIRGLVRGDIYWGCGQEASFLGEHMKNKGCFWLLLPKYAQA